MDWGSLISDAANGDTKQRLAVLPALQDYVENNSLSRDEVADLMRVSEALIKDHNFKICQGILQVLHAAILQDGDAFKPHTNVFIPPTIEKLGDAKPTVREAAQRVLLAVSEIIPVGAMLEKVAWGWGHKNHHIREELANTVTLLFQSIGFGSINATEERQLLTSIISVMEDPTASVREAALGFLGEMYCQTGNHLVELLKQFDIRPAQQREIDACFAEISPIQNTVDRANVLPKSQSEKSLSDKSEKGTRPSSARPSNVTKRGGFGDAGGLTADGELPKTEPVAVSSESDFKQKCSKLLPELDVKKDWDARIRAMLQLEGMVLGGASRLSNFLDELRNLKDALTEQLNDRRSAVSRVACHLLGELAVTLGNKFEPLAVHFLPYMMKVSVISVQVMADAAVDGMETIIRHCRARGAVVPILNAIINERNKVMRTHCSKVFLLMLEVWERKAYEKNLDLIEKAMAAAVQDAQADVRTNGRLCYGAYAQACPDRVADYLKKLQPALREKLLQAGAEYVRQNEPYPASGSVGNDNLVSASGRPVSAPVRRDSEIGMKPPSARSTVAGGALRITTAEESHDEVPNRRLSSARAGPTRVPAHPGRSAGPPSYGRQGRTSEVGPRRVFERDLHHDDTDSASYNGSSAISQGSSGHAMSLSAVLKKIRTAKGATDWERKRDGFNDLRDWISEHGQGAGHELSRQMDKLVPTVMDNTKDAHHQVVVAALEAWAEMAKYGSKPMEPYLERLMGCAFLRAVDAKAVIRTSAQGAMMAVAASFPADVLLVAMNKCLAGVKSAKGKVAVMEYSAAAVGAGTVAGPPSQGAALSSWVESCAKELGDRSPDVRKVAGAALEHVYKSIDAVTVLAYITATASSEAASIKRALARGVPDLSAELAAFQRNGGASLLGSVSDAERNRKVSKAACSAPHSPISPSGAKNAPGPASSPDASCNLPTLKQQNANTSEAATGVRTRGGQNLGQGGAGIPPMPVCADSVDGHTTSSAREAAPIHIDHCDDGYGGPAISEPSNKENIENANRVDVYVSSAPLSPTVQPSPATKIVQQQQQQQMYASPQHHMPAASTYAPNAYAGTPCSTPGSEAPMDPAVAEARLRMLVGRLNTPDGPSPDTLIGIQDLARTACDPAWQACFSQVLLGLMHIINNPNEQIQEFAVEALREMTVFQTSLFIPHLDLVLPVLLNLSQSARQVSLSADEATEQLVRRTNPQRCLDILALRLPTAETHGSGTAADGMVLQAAIRNVGRAVACLRPAELMLRVPGLLPGLFESFRNLSADVRKAVVFCLVDIYLVVGDQLMPLLSPLSTSQLKLVTIYVNRAAQRLDRPPPMAQVA